MIDRALESAEAHLAAGRFEPARAALTRALQKSPGDGAANNLMSTLLARTGQVEQAVFYARRAAEAEPRLAGLRFNLGRMLSTLDRHDEAMGEIRGGLALEPGSVDGRAWLAGALIRAGRYAEACGSCREGLGLPAGAGHHELTLRLADSLLLLGRAGEAVAVLEEGVRRHPGSPAMARLLAATCTYDPASTPERTLAAHRRCGELMPEVVPVRSSRAADRDADRPLRVGFMSADFRDHPVARFVEPMLRHLGRGGGAAGELEVVAYHTSAVQDATTARLRALVPGWRHVVGMTYEQFARRLAADRIDILFELAGYTVDTVIDVAPYRPAPILITAVGYPSTTGVPAIDYRLVDSLTDPAGSDGLATERLLRLDPCFLCYSPPEAIPACPLPPSGDSPAGVTFGSFNALQKVNDPLLRLWARVLGSAPGSRLVIKNQGLAEEAARVEFVGGAARAGIEGGRLTILPPAPTHAEHLEAYRHVDLSLDTFPYCGTTTTCESLLMGVPVVSLAGRTHASRVGLSLLSAVGLSDLCAGSEEEYVAIAGGLAADRTRLAALRGTLRSRLLASPLCDGPGYGQRLGAALRRLWRERCSRAAG